MRNEKRLGQIGGCGDGVFQVEIKDTTRDDYQSSLDILEKSGFVKHVDNGSEGLDKTV